MQANRAAWNERHQRLRSALSSTTPQGQADALTLFLEQHACVHQPAVAPERPAGAWSFAAEVCADLPERAWRYYAPRHEHSIAWLIWHSARIEDVTMNLLLAGEEQVFTCQGWDAPLKAGGRDTGNASSGEQIEQLSREIDLEALRAYRDAVGVNTRALVARIPPEQLSRKVGAEQLARAQTEGAVPPEAQGLLEYWGGLTYAGLLLMPPTRHNFVHLNEILRLRPAALRS